MSRLIEAVRKKIRKTFKELGSIRATAQKVGVSRNAVRRELRGPLVKTKNKVRIVSSRKKSRLDPYKAKIHYLVKEKHLSAVRVFEEIKELGYEGGYTILKDHIRTVRPKRTRGPSAPIDHPPGHEGQMDWSPHRTIIGGREQTVHTGSIVLCFSRWLYMHFFLDETTESVIQLHKKAFKELNAVPEIMTYDNMTTVGFHRGPGEVWINPVFKNFADEYGFEIVILPPGAKDRHGVVERPFHYIEHNFLAGREFADLEEINRRGDLWRKGKANIRIHGTLRERPDDRLKRERPFLKPLPHVAADAYVSEVKRLIHRDFCVRIDTNLYSANPDLEGKYADVRLYKKHLEIWVDGKMDCRHTYSDKQRNIQVLPEHEKAYKDLTHQSKLLEKAFMRIGDIAKSYYEGLKRIRGAAAGYHLQRILKMTDRHGSDVVAGALSYAQRYGAYSADSVLRVIHGRALKHKGPSTENIPEAVKQWLRSCAVDKQELKNYDQIISKINKKDDGGGEGNES